MHRQDLFRKGGGPRKNPELEKIIEKTSEEIREIFERGITEMKEGAVTDTPNTAPERIVIAGPLEECGSYYPSAVEAEGEHGGSAIEYVRADLSEARVKELLQTLKPALDTLPDGVWETWTSCSFRRISKQGGGDGDVLHALTHCADGHPDLSWTEEECDAICAIVNGLRAALEGNQP